MKEYYPVPSQDNQIHQAAQNSDNNIGIQELLATIGELHVSNRRLLIRVDELTQLVNGLRTRNQELNAIGTKDGHPTIDPSIADFHGGIRKGP